jgi:hypothetical protein
MNKLEKFYISETKYPKHTIAYTNKYLKILKGKKIKNITVSDERIIVSTATIEVIFEINELFWIEGIEKEK